MLPYKIPYHFVFIQHCIKYCFLTAWLIILYKLTTVVECNNYLVNSASLRGPPFSSIHFHVGVVAFTQTTQL